ncbi:hypothetical protein GCM10023324_17560 [Streptomyces youssoufiensis]
MPRVAAALGFSGSLSITRKRYSSGHRMKSAARDGDSDDDSGARDAARPAFSVVPMPQDCTARH